MSDDRTEIYQDKRGEWRWKRIAGNGQIIAVGEGYSRKFDAMMSARRLFEEDEPEAPGA